MRKLTLSLAILATMMPVGGYPLGLGDIELNSALNQELDAEIEVLSSQPEDAEQLIIKLASREAFARAGIDRPFWLQQLKFKVINKNGKSFIQVQTKKPVREPFLSFLVEIDWPKGHLLREYTLLLDPPVYTGATSASTSSSQDGERPFIDPADQAQNQSAKNTGAQPVESAFDSSSTTHSGGFVGVEEADGSTSYTAEPQSQFAEQTTQISGQYRVQANDTLWSLSNRMKPNNSVSVEQMMMALVRHNPEAFIKENINGLKRGYILRMPDEATIAATDRQEALAQVREHSALWRQYREAKMGITPSSSLESEDGGVTPQAMPDTSADGQLSIVGASETDGSDKAVSGDPDASNIKALRNELAMAREALESERLEKDDLQVRLSELEQRVQNVLQMDEAELAKLQQDLQGVKEETEQPVEAIEKPVEEAVAEEIVEPPVTDEMSVDETVVEPVAEEVEQAVVEEAVDKPAEEALFVDEAADKEPVTEEDLSTTPVEQVDVPDFVQPKKPKSFIENLADDPSMLAAIAGGLLGVFVLIGILLRRRRVNKDDDEFTAASDDLGDLGYLSEPEEDVEATQKTEAVDMDATGEMDLGLTAEMENMDDDLAVDFDDTHIEAPDDMEDTVISLDDGMDEPVQAEEADDVIAEADVYLAYGIYQQAEELLGNAISENPERDDYRMKLLETHFAGKNSTAFAALAAEAHQRKGDDKAYWDRVVAMGRDLCPENNLFTGSGSIPDFNADDLLPEKPQTTDLDLDAGDDAGATGLDLGFDDEEASDATQVLNAPVDPAMETPAGSGEDEMGDLLDDSELEFDLGDFGEELEEASDSIADAPEESLDDLDASLDLGDIDLGEGLDETIEAEVDLGADLDIGDDLDIGADLDLEAEAKAEVEADLDIDEDFSLDFEASDLGFDSDADDAAADLDLGSDTEVSGLDMDTASESVSLGDDSDNDFDMSSLSEDLDEVSTKLDLAKAYIDMGDNEGAKSILEEVKQEGNDKQQQLADELLKQAS